LFLLHVYQEFIACGIGVSHHLKDMREVQQRAKQAIVVERVSMFQKELHKTLRPAVTLTVVEDWKVQYEVAKRRYKMLVLHGESMFGKSVYAVSLFGENSTLLVDCSGGKTPDLREFDCLAIKCIVMDEMSLQQVMQYKRLLQAPAMQVTLGTSSTQMYSYEVWVARCAFVITTNRFHEDFAQLDKSDQRWVTANCLDVAVTAPLWVP
jgi:hypothetical protein